jgi:polysaccharide deacetylase family protein (PEP-CTERM system associated)
MNFHLLSVDLEDWHTSGYLREYVKQHNYVDQMEDSTLPILDLFAKKNVTATFFTLGSVAGKHPALIKKIHAAGHEIASHGYSHIPLWDLTPEAFHKEITKTNKILEDITGKKVKGFRAPYCSLQHSTAWSLDILEAEGFTYDSSIFPMRTNLYGVNNAPTGIYRISSANIIRDDPNAKLKEIPFTVFRKGFIKIPCTGGIYGRILPAKVLKIVLGKVAKQRPLNFYFHPWETYPGTPRIPVPLFHKTISYYNTKSYLKKIEGILASFAFTSFEHFFARQATAAIFLITFYFFGV